MRMRRSFTLIELVVVTVISALAIGLAANTLRQRSGPAQFDQAAREFRQFCVATRSQAMELGRDRVVYYYFKDRTFRSSDPIRTPPPREEETIILKEVPEEYRTDTEDPESSNYIAPPNFASLKWQIPEDYRIRNGGADALEYVDSLFENDDENLECVEVFRFFSDGGAAGELLFTLQFKRWAKTFRISPLTGRILEEESEAHE